MEQGKKRPLGKPFGNQDRASLIRGEAVGPPRAPAPGGLIEHEEGDPGGREGKARKGSPAKPEQVFPHCPCTKEPFRAGVGGELGVGEVAEHGGLDHLSEPQHPASAAEFGLELGVLGEV